MRLCAVGQYLVYSVGFESLRLYLFASLLVLSGGFWEENMQYPRGYLLSLDQIQSNRNEHEVCKYGKNSLPYYIFLRGKGQSASPKSP